MGKLPIGDISPCEVVFDFGVGPSFLNLNLSPFLDKVSLKRDDSIQKVFEEGFGDAAVDAVFSGAVYDLTIPMTRSSWVKLAAVLPGCTIVGGALVMANKCGGNMYDDAYYIIIKPMVDLVPSPDEATWTHLYKCYPYAAWEVGWARDGQRVFATKWMVFPSQDTPTLGKFGHFGDLTP